MTPSEKILDILNQRPANLMEWGYNTPTEFSDGVKFWVNTFAYHPGWVRVVYEDAEGCYYVKAAETEYGFYQEVGFVQQEELFEVLDKLVHEGFTDEEVEEIRRRWWNTP